MSGSGLPWPWGPTPPPRGLEPWWLLPWGRERARLRARALRRRPLPTPSSCPLSLPKRQDVSSSGGTEPHPVREPLEAQVTGAALWTEQWLGVQRGVRHPTCKVDQENVLPLLFSKLLRASTLTEKNICVPCLEAEPTTEGVNEEAPVRIDNSH